MSFSAPEPPQINIPPPPITPQAPPKKPKQKSMQPTFLGTGTVPQQGLGQGQGKTLLGQ